MSAPRTIPAHVLPILEAVSRLDPFRLYEDGLAAGHVKECIFCRVSVSAPTLEALLRLRFQHGASCSFQLTLDLLSRREEPS